MKLWSVLMLILLPVLTGSASAGLVFELFFENGYDYVPEPPISDFVISYDPYGPSTWVDLIPYDPEDWAVEKPWPPDNFGEIDPWTPEPLGHDEYLENLERHWEFLENPDGMDWMRLGKNYTFGP